MGKIAIFAFEVLFVSFIVNLTSGLVGRETAISITIWGWFVIAGHATCSIFRTDFVTRVALKTRARFKDAQMLSYIIVTLLGAALASGYWYSINYFYKRVGLITKAEPEPESAPPADKVSTPFDGRVNVKKALPGLSLHTFIRVNNLPAARRKYIFDFGHTQKERFSVYISSDNIFTFSFVDAKNEPHVIQLPVGGNGFPIGRFVYMCCDLGISGESTELRMYVDGEEIGSLILPFKTDVGALDVGNGVMGSDLSGENGSAVDVGELMIYGFTVNALEIKDHIRPYLLSKKDKRYVEFQGTQWLRVADAPPGSRDANQPDPAKQPRWRTRSD